MAGSPYAGDSHPPVPPQTHLFDVPTYLSYVAAKTERIVLGSYVYLLGLRHPFISARGWGTLDRLSGGRTILGAGAGWLESEWRAIGLDPRTRGARLDEAIEVCRRLWTEDVVEHHGTHFEFDPVAFEPKPVRAPIPIHIGGESATALSRVARLGDGWLAMYQTTESMAVHIETLRKLLDDQGRSLEEIETTVGGASETESDMAAWEVVGVDRLIVRPWERSKDAVAGLRAFATRFIAG
jgi:probable F420-dependent oxidoreductase